MTELVAATGASFDVTSVVVVLLGGGFITGLVALLKFKPEKDAIVVSAAQGAVVVQSGVIDALQEELDRARADLSALREDFDAMRRELNSTRTELNDVRAERDGLRQELEEVKRENTALKARVQTLENGSG